MPRAVLVLEERPASFDRAPPLAPGRVVAVAVAGPRGAAVAASLVERCAGFGAACRVVDATGPDTGALVDLRALDAPADAAGALASAKASLFLAQRARSALLEAAKAGGAFYLVVTQLAGAHPVSAAVHGLLKTAALEWPEVACSVVDVDPALDVAGVVAEEMRAGFVDLEVVRAPGSRRVPVLVERAVEPSRARLGPADVVVASGGARGVTAVTLLALARAARCAFVLLGRTPLVDEPAHLAGAADEAALKRAILDEAKRSGEKPSLPAVGERAKAVLAVREIRAFLDDMEAAGARVLYRAVDVRDRDAVARACADGRAAFGPITGVVHGAGVLADKRIEDKTAEQVDRVMDTKVLGLDALLAATAGDPLRSVALFSSVAGRFGNVGQVDYAMANEALNEVAVDLANKRPGVVVKSFNWGPWEGGMVTPALKKRFEERGVRVLSHDDGARHFVDELAARDGSVEVVFGGALDGAEKPAGPHRVSIHVDARTFPAFADHALQDTAVLPAVGALALIAGVARATSFTDVRVLRGVQMPRFFDEGHDVVVTVDGDRCALALSGDAAPRYTARVAPPAAAVPAAAGARALDGLGRFRFDDDAVYDGLLFHGPRFQLVSSVVGCGERGLVARVAGSLARGWGDGLALDVGALDAALQAVLLWGRHLTGGAYLPTSIARVDAGPARDGRPLTCRVLGAVCDDIKARADVLLVDDAGAIVASLEGVELHRLPDDAAFRRNRARPVEAAE